jgi:hypothetical protein
VEGLASFKIKEETTNNRLDRYVGAMTTLATFAHTNWRKMMVINLDQLAS